MTQRIVIPVEDNTGLDAPVAPHFGRAPYFAIVDLDDNRTIISTKSEINRGEHVGGTGHPHEHLLSLKPDIFVVYGMGPGCLMSLQDAGITVLKAEGNTANDIAKLYKQGKLEPLTGACPHSHEHEHSHEHHH
jgi:predicted Fe-Mo cluster-binding NifX family protein